MSTDVPSSVPAESVIPHRSPVRMIDSVSLHGRDGATATAVLPDGHMGVAEGKVLESAMVECVAQTVAAMEGMRRAPGAGQVRIGMLCGVSDFVVRKRPEAGRQLEIRVRETKRLGPMILVWGEIRSEGEVVAAGELKLHGGN